MRPSLARLRSGGDGRGRVRRFAAMAAAPEETKDDQLDSPSGVHDGGAEVGTDRSLRLEDIDGIWPGIQRGVKEQDKEEAPARTVVEPGRNDRQRDRAHREEGKGRWLWAVAGIQK